jgi:hypothetical protein
MVQAVTAAPIPSPEALLPGFFSVRMRKKLKKIAGLSALR